MESMNRRQFIRTSAGSVVAGAAGLGWLSSAFGADTPPPGRRPNIVVIITDDQRFDALSCMGHPFLRTPNLDRIRNEGVLFSNAFVTTSLCSPSRASFLTGTYAHTHGVMLNATNDYDPAATPSFCQILREQGGYRTAFVGKWHLDSTEDNPREGFDYWLSFKGQGVYFDPQLNENGKRFKRQGYITDILTEYADQWIRRTADRPFCLYLSHKAVHGPFQPAPRHKGKYTDVEIAEPANYRDSRRGKPEWKRTRWTNRLRSSVPPEVVDEAEQAPFTPRKYHKGYMEAILAVDEGVGKILDTLDELGIADDTIVMFTSDNGYFLGQHGRGDKRLAYEDSIRIPMVMRYPRRVKAGSTMEQMMLNIDVGPTMLEFAGVKAPPVMQGLSAATILAGGEAPWRKGFLYEYWQDLTPSIPRMVAIRTERWKYVRYPDIDQHELYDLLADPLELVNLVDRPDHAGRVKQLRAELERLMRETEYRAEAVTASSKKPRGVVAALDFDNITDGRAIDSSGNGNHGRIDGAVADAGRKGKALRFTGTESVVLGRSDSLDVAFSPWTVDAWIKADAGDGVICAQGGQRLGYLLFLENGVPGFAVKDGHAVYIADAREPVVGTWTHVMGTIEENKAGIWVNGERIDSINLMHVLRATPTDPFCVGRDTGSPVDPQISAHGFRGLIDSVRLRREIMDDEKAKASYGD